MKLLTPLLTLCLLSATSLAAGHRELSIDTDQLKAFTLEAGAGSLEIRGEEGRSQILVKATIRTDYGESLDADDYQLTLEPKGDRAVLFAKINENFRGDAQIDLDVLMPKGLTLDVTDGSGELRVENIAADVSIEDGSGETEVRHLSGNLRVRDGSGDLHIHTVAGKVDIVDGSGGLEVSAVGDNLSIDDGSGSIEVTHVTGLVEISDGSGDIRVDDVGDFYLRSDGSGSVELTNLRK